MKEGQAVLNSSWPSFPDQTFKGVVQAQHLKGDPIARSYRVRIHFSEPSPFKIGMTAETNIILRETENALLIPTSAVVGDRVRVVKMAAWSFARSI